jgi:hypothetical protein
MFTITIETTNAAFHDDNGSYYPAPTLAELLRRVADTLEDDVFLTSNSTVSIPSTSIGVIVDPNGNHVGEWRHDTE